MYSLKAINTIEKQTVWLEWELPLDHVGDCISEQADFQQPIRPPHGYLSEWF